jgi:hypothetical protein
MVVHLGMLVFIPLFAVAVYVLLLGVEGTAARVSRIALVFFVVFYGAFEMLQGIGVGTRTFSFAVSGSSPASEASR